MDPSAADHALELFTSSVKADVRRLCASTQSVATVLVVGELGTGKGLVARAIHHGGARREGPFVEVRCNALPPWLLDTELFGHAHSARAGAFQTAGGGSLFLDEITSLPSKLQDKLLDELDRHGDAGGVRLIAAAQPEALETAPMKAALLERLGRVRIAVPALRARGDDKLELAERVLAALLRRHGLAPRAFAPDAQQAILNHDWPGNLRELEARIESVLWSSQQPEIRASDLQLHASASTVSLERGRSGMRLKLPAGGVALRDLEREALRDALEQCGWNISAAARFLRITRQAVMYRMKKYGLAKDQAGRA